MIDTKRLFRHFVEQKEMMEDRIQLGIESHRKGYARLNFVDESGEPVQDVKVSIRQLSHDFKFGCNIFKYKGFADDESNRLYEEKFKKLFNLAVAPFYWDSFEPVEGKTRFEKDSPFIDRRPAPEQVLEFCREHDIEVKGHPLFWLLMLPEWLPKNYEELKPLLTRRLRQIAERYDGVIKSFDCVNEMTSVPLRSYESSHEHYRNFVPVGGDYPEWVFRQANRFFADSKLVVNETTAAWDRFMKELSPFYMLVERLLNKGCRVDEIGLQYHLFYKPEDLAERVDVLGNYNPSHLYQVMDCYGQFQRPLCVSEITIPGYGDNGDELQAEAIRNLYRIWFSHPWMESIVYWNLGDNCAIAQGGGWAEDQYRSGLTRDDFSEKPSYQVLDQLINREWQTNLDLEAAESHLYFKGFYGKYEIAVIRNGQESKRQIHLSKAGYDQFTMVC